MTDMTASAADTHPAVAGGPVLAADGTPLRKKLAQALFISRLRAFGLVTPLLLFILASFIIPIGLLLWQGVSNNTYAKNMPTSAELLSAWDAESELDEAMFAALVEDLVAAREAKTIGKVATRVNQELSGTRSLFTSTARKAKKMEPPFKEALLDADKDWEDIKVWQAMKVAAKSTTPAFLAAATDFEYQADGSFERVEERKRIYVWLFVKTILVALAVTIFCILLGYPVAYLLAHLPVRTSNLLMILVLLPFWTSLLVRTTAWIAMLQSEGVLNDLSVTFGLTSDDQRFSLIYNMTGTLIAMTHIPAVHDLAALFGDEDHPALLYARGQIAWRHQLDSVLAGLCTPDRAWHRGRKPARLHPGDRLLHHAGTGRRSGWPADLQFHRLSHAKIAELVARRSPCDLPPGRGARPLLDLRPPGRHRQHELG